MLNGARLQRNRAPSDDRYYSELADGLVGAVALDLEDEELRPDDVAAGGEADRAAEDRALELDLRQVLAHLGTADLAVLARRRDRRRVHLREHVVRSAERRGAAR